MIIPESILLQALQNSQILLDWLSAERQCQMLARSKDHLLVRVQQLLDGEWLDRTFAGYHHASGPGAPATYASGMLARALLVGKLYGYSTRDLERYLQDSTIAKWFVGLQEYQCVPDHSTLERFEQWVMRYQRRSFFDEVLRQLDAAYPAERQQNQVGDTYAMLANAAREDLLPRVRHVCLRLLEAFKPLLSQAGAAALSQFDWVGLFGVPQERPLGLMPKEHIQQTLQTALRAAYALRQRISGVLAGCPPADFPDARTWLAYLEKLLRDEAGFTLDETGQVLTAVELPAKEKGEFRLVSATDPHASYRVHGKGPEKTTLGYNIQVAATLRGVIRETRAYTGATPDQSGIAALLSEQLQHLGSCPPKLLYDQAGGWGKVLAEVERVSSGRTQLSVRVAQMAQRSPRFSPYQFSLSPDGSTLTCPHGQAAANPQPDADGRVFHFLPGQCWSGQVPAHMPTEDLSQRCPLWQQCRDHRQGPRSERAVFISDYRQQVLDAQAYATTQAFDQDRRQRPRIERVILELTRYNDARYCRRVGLEAADWQAKMSAVAYNLKLWVRRARRQAQA